MLPGPHRLSYATSGSSRLQLALVFLSCACRGIKLLRRCHNGDSAGGQVPEILSLLSMPASLPPLCGSSSSCVSRAVTLLLFMKHAVALGVLNPLSFPLQLPLQLP